MTILTYPMSDLFKISNFDQIKKLKFNFFIINFHRNDFLPMEVKIPTFIFCFEYETNLFDRFLKNTSDKIMIF